MPYDEDLSSYRFRDLEDLASSAERFLSTPENMTIVRLGSLVQAVHAILAGRPSEKVGMGELAQGLRQRGLAGVPFNTVLRTMEVVSGADPKGDVLSHVTLRDAQRIVAP
jgi:hypothetical protein